VDLFAVTIGPADLADRQFNIVFCISPADPHASGSGMSFVAMLVISPGGPLASA
jgi:hypothetical protein